MFKLTFNKKLYFLKTFSIQSSLEILDSKKLITKKEFNLFSVHGAIFLLADGIAFVVNFSGVYMAISNREANAVLFFLMVNFFYIFIFLVSKFAWRI
jgi:hypothetical protein